MTPDDIYAAMARDAARSLPTDDALQFLSQCANSWLSVKREFYDGYIRIHVISVPKDRRGEGYGTAIMRALCAVADKRGWTLTLSPSVDFGASSVSRLERFYKGFGFVPNRGRRRDFDTRATMIRQPTDNRCLCGDWSRRMAPCTTGHANKGKAE